MTDFTFHDLTTATGESKEILEQVQKGYGFVPNLFGYMAEAPIALKAYLQLNELLSESSIPAGQLQVALLAISKKNECDFCSTAHHAMSKNYGSNEQTVSAILNSTDIENLQDRVLVKTVTAILENKGWVSEDLLNTFFEAGFTKQQYFELMVVVAIKTLSNYTNHVTKPEVNPELIKMIG